jgi:hypothetical protein
MNDKKQNLELNLNNINLCLDGVYVGNHSGYMHTKSRDKKLFDNTTIFTSILYFLKNNNMDSSNHFNQYFNQIKDTKLNDICKNYIGSFVNKIRSLEKRLNVLKDFFSFKIQDINTFNIFELPKSDIETFYHIIIYSNSKKVCICLHNNLIYMNDKKQNLELNLNNINLCLDGVYVGNHSGYMHTKSREKKLSIGTFYLDYQGTT